MDTVCYFDDLTVTNVQDRIFDGSYTHHQQHFSADTFSLEMIAAGSVDLKLDQNLLRLNAPAVICTGDNNRFYRFYYCRSQRTYRHLWIDFCGSRGRRIYSAFLKMFPFGLLNPAPRRAAAILALYEDINRIFCWEETDPAQMVVKIEQLVYLCLASGGGNAVKNSDPFQLRQLCEYILQHPFEEYTLARLAAERNISQVYLRKLFQQQSGISLNRFIFKARMEMAAELLNSHTFRIGELAEMCHFSDISAFSRAFKRMYGVAPRKSAARSPVENKIVVNAPDQE